VNGQAMFYQNTGSAKSKDSIGAERCRCGRSRRVVSLGKREPKPVNGGVTIT